MLSLQIRILRFNLWLRLSHCMVFFLPSRCVHQLTLVFEFLDQDLKKYLDVCENGMEPQIIKWFLFQLLQVQKHVHARINNSMRIPILSFPDLLVLLFCFLFR